MKKNTIAVAIALGLILIGAIVFCFTVPKGGKTYKSEFDAMDTACTMTLYKKTHGDEYKSEIMRLDGELDRYNPKSCIYAFNLNHSAELTDDAMAIYEQSKELFSEYGRVNITCGGLVSVWGINGGMPRVPSETEIRFEQMNMGFDKLSENGNTLTSSVGTQLDLGAVAKGYTLDRLYSRLKSNGEKCAVISLGSSTLLYGQKPDKKPFVTAVKDPADPSREFLTFESGECFVSTSGGYERYSEIGGRRYVHIIDLYTGAPSASDLAGVTVICDSGIKSDFLSTAIFIDGTAGLDKYLNDPGIQVIAITNKGALFYSPSLEGKIKVNS